METPNIETKSKPIRLTKKGLPDKRRESSVTNLNKGKSIIKEALKEIKNKIKPRYVEKDEEYSSDNYSTDEEEETFSKPIEEISTKPIEKVLVKPIEVLPVTEDYKFTFEKKLNEMTSEYNLKFHNIELKNKSELDELKKQNQVLKKNITSNFRTHTGILNQEMYLKF